MGEYIEIKCPHCGDMIPKSLSTCPACKQPTSIKPVQVKPVKIACTEKKCSRCGMIIPASAVVCPFCRRNIGMTPVKKLIAGLFIFMVGSCVLGQAVSKLSPPQSARPAAKQIDKYTDAQNITVRGRTISVGDNYDDVVAILTASDLIEQRIYPDDKRPGSLYLVKEYAADGKKFCLYVSRIEDPGPYKVIGIGIK